MGFGWIRREKRVPPQAPRSSGAEMAYLFLEAARLQCEERRDCTGDSSQGRWLATVHRQIGMAGYLVSEAIPGGRRRHLADLARERHSTRALPAPYRASDPTVANLLMARRAIACTPASDTPEPEQLAHGHLAAALVLLAGGPGADPPAQREHRGLDISGSGRVGRVDRG